MVNTTRSGREAPAPRAASNSAPLSRNATPGGATGATSPGAASPNGHQPVEPVDDWARVLVGAFAVAVLAVLAGSVFSRIYSGSTLLLLVVGASAIAVGLSVLLRAARIPLAFSALLSLGALFGYLLVAVAVTRDQAQDSGSIAALFSDAVRNSGARILTSTIPILPTPDTVVLPLAVVWLSAMAGAELAVRARNMLAATVPPTLGYTAGLVLVGPNAAPSPWFAVSFLVISAAALAITGAARVSGTLKQLGRATRSRYRARRIVLVIAGIVALLVGTIMVGPWVADWSDQRPADPRTRVAAPQQRLPEANPLARLAGWAREPDTDLFTVRTPEPNRIGWVVLSDYDGLTWTPGTRYRSAGSVLPVQDRASQTLKVKQEFQMQGLDGVWLPAVAQADEVTGVRVSYDETTGTLLRPQGVEADLRYTVVSERPRYNVANLSKANTPSEARFNRYREHSRVPAEISTLATQTASAGSSAYQQALLLERFLKENYTFSPEAPSGHSYPNLKFFLDTPLEQGGHRGTSEQFATAFALLGRVIGLPTRVVVGFHAGTKLGDENLYQVRTGDAYAWPEVYLESYGWVAFNPTPQASEDTPPPPEEATAEAQEQDDQKANQLDELDDPSSEPPSDKDKAAEAGNDSWSLAFLIAAFAGALVIAALVLIVVLRRRRRRQRLNHAEPARRVIGGWLEVREAMRQAGRAPLSDASVTAVAEQAQEPLGETALPTVTDLASAVNQASFAYAPTSIATIDPSTADTAVSESVAYVAALRKALPWWRRLLWPLDPRPLAWNKQVRR